MSAHFLGCSKLASSGTLHIQVGACRLQYDGYKTAFKTLCHTGRLKVWRLDFDLNSVGSMLLSN